LCLIIDLEQPPHLRFRSAKERDDWWENCKHLKPDAFVCLIASSGRVIFFFVNEFANLKDWREKEMKRRLTKSKKWTQDDDYVPNLYTSGDRVQVLLKFAKEDADNIMWVINNLKDKNQSSFCLVEFPGILLPTFMPILRALQARSKTLDVPFAQYIASDDFTSPELEIRPPPYLSTPGFSLNLGSLTPGKELKFSLTQPFDYAKLRNATKLDEGQQTATIDTLRSSLALI